MASDFFFSPPPHRFLLCFIACVTVEREISFWFILRGKVMAVVTWMERNDSCFLFRWDLTIDSFFLSFPFLLFSFLSFSFRFREIEFYFRIFRPANWLTSCYYRNKGIQYRNIIIIIIIITKARSFIIIFSFSPRCKRFSRDTDKNSYLYNRITHIQIFHRGSSSRRNL